ncbi:MAG: V-type ATPase 116kDa subunit family protein, partial [Elusimicrobiota bacterium]|nr:V-type ATPase 116kDa subunit family protein [Elusimicrobiota bacterium]
LYDYYSELYKIKDAQEKLQHTQETFIIEGWIQELSEKKLITQLNSISNAIEIYFRYPLKDENPPIVLKNKKLIMPFEFLTTLFDRPQYTEFDPTPLFTPFFVVFFALCVSDIFYGIIATVLGFIGVHVLSKKPGFNPNSGSFRLFKIILSCGLLTILCGIITDSLAGFSISNPFRQIKKFVVVNPLQEPMKMLVISLLLGIIQLVFGMLIKLIKNFKSKDLFGVVDELLLIAMTISVVPLAYMFMFGKIISERIFSISKNVFPLAGILFLVFVIGRKLITNPIDCIATVFGTWGIFGDTMSYSRIFGIALSGAAIAQIINAGVISLATGSFFGYIFAVMLFVFGHSVNFLMNLLGAFVHSARLQFLEFFSKFFDGGGRAFQPFCQQRKYTVEI